MKVLITIAGLILGFVAGYKMGNARFSSGLDSHTPQYLYEED